MRQGAAVRELDTALTQLVEAALTGTPPVTALDPSDYASAPRRRGTLPDPPSPTATPALADQLTQALVRALAPGLAAGLRELIRAPLREALQAGYELGYRAALSAQPTDATGPVAAAAGGPSAAARPGPDAGGAADPPPSAHTPGVLVDVGPFPSFSAVNRFHAAIAAAPGVSDATIVAFRGNRLALRVAHPDGLQLAADLAGLGLGSVRVLAAERGRLALALGDAPCPDPQAHTE